MFIRSLVGRVGLFAILSGTCLSTPLSLGKDLQERPFKGYAQGMVTELVPPNQLVINASGTATHLGKFTREEQLFLNPDGSVAGTIVFVAANGDELYVDFTGAFTSATTAEGTYTFTSGTGRFLHASGEATFEAFTPDGINVEVIFAGKIRY